MNLQVTVILSYFSLFSLSTQVQASWYQMKIKSVKKPVHPYFWAEHGTFRQIFLNIESPFSVEDSVNCKTDWCIYLIRCKQPGCVLQYVGQTINTVAKRMSSHKSHIRHNTGCKVLSAHFTQIHSHGRGGRQQTTDDTFDAEQFITDLVRDDLLRLRYIRTKITQLNYERTKLVYLSAVLRLSVNVSTHLMRC